MHLFASKTRFAVSSPFVVNTSALAFALGMIFSCDSFLTKPNIIPYKIRGGLYV